MDVLLGAIDYNDPHYADVPSTRREAWSRADMKSGLVIPKCEPGLQQWILASCLLIAHNDFLSVFIDIHFDPITRTWIDLMPTVRVKQESGDTSGYSAACIRYIDPKKDVAHVKDVNQVMTGHILKAVKSIERTMKDQEPQTFAATYELIYSDLWRKCVQLWTPDWCVDMHMALNHGGVDGPTLQERVCTNPGCDTKGITEKDSPHKKFADLVIWKEPRPNSLQTILDDNFCKSFTLPCLTCRLPNTSCLTQQLDHAPWRITGLLPEWFTSRQFDDTVRTAQKFTLSPNAVIVLGPTASTGELIEYELCCLVGDNARQMWMRSSFDADSKGEWFHLKLDEGKVEPVDADLIPKTIELSGVVLLRVE